MIWFFGTRMYGKVDHVPGLFYVATNFFYIQFVPLVPTGSVLVIYDGSERGKQLGLSGKSIVFAYLRALLILGGPGLVILGVIEIEKNPVVALALIGIGIASIIFFFLTYKVAKPSVERALRIAGEAGIPPEVVAHFFVDADIPVSPHGHDDPVDVLPAYADEDEDSDNPRRRYRDDDVDDERPRPPRRRDRDERDY